jgi:signal transduction histidine kinase
VEDTGPGIPAAAQARVFELHARAAPTEVHGLGLGLATVKKLAEALRGGAGVRPNRGCGSVFWIELPKMPVRDEKTLGS